MISDRAPLSARFGQGLLLELLRQGNTANILHQDPPVLTTPINDCHVAVLNAVESELRVQNQVSFPPVVQVQDKIVLIVEGELVKNVVADLCPPLLTERREIEELLAATHPTTSGGQKRPF